jgi:glycerol kinase
VFIEVYPMAEHFILAVDQGTSGTKAVIFDSQGKIHARAAAPLTSSYPRPGFVEQNPQQIFQSVLDSIKLCLNDFTDKASGRLADIVACGISNQRETFMLWNEKGEPLTEAIVWQCKRSVDICRRLKNSGKEDKIKNRTGLIIDPYFSGTKLIWLYENDKQVKASIDAGKAYFGTVDTWLLYKLTGGRKFCTDYTNASRTLLFNIVELQWDMDLLDEFGLQNLSLPQVKPSSAHYGESDFDGLFPEPIKISAMIGDSHAAAFGEGCFSPGRAKATLGTGCSILLNTGSKRVPSDNGMVTTICFSAGDRVDYALEGIIVTCGATINWLRDSLQLFTDSHQTQKMALSVEDNNGVYLVPAFSGLGAPHWKMDARAAVVGLTFGCDKNHIVRAALESIPYQIKDVIAAMEADSGIELAELKVDGGITANNFVMQFLADLLMTNVVNIGLPDVSALGAAYLAGLHERVFSDIDRIESLNVNKKQFTPGPNTEIVKTSYHGWKKAVSDFCD